MKRIGLSFLLIAFFSLTAWSQNTQFPIGISGFPRAKLKGPVKTVLTVQQRDDYVFETMVEPYDRQGRLVGAVSSNAHIEVHSRTLVRLGGKKFYSYDSQGRLAKTKHFSPEGRYGQSEVFTYDNQNRLIGTTIYNANGKETGKRTYTYFPDKREVLATWNFYYDGRIPRPSKDLLFLRRKESVDEANGI